MRSKVQQVVDRFPNALAPLRIALVAVVPGGAFLLALSSTGLLDTRVTPAPELAPAESPWLVARGAAIDDSACQLSLRVTDEQGSAVDAAHVSVVELKEGAIARTFEARTDRKGTHRLLDLDPGFYDVTVDVDGKALQGTPTFRCETAGQRAFFDVVVADSDRVVTGHLQGRHKKPLAWSTVALFQDDKNRKGLAGAVRVRTDENGDFKARLPAGDYVVYASANEHVARKSTLRVTEPLTKVKLALAFSPAVRGVVVDEEGRPIKNAEVAMGDAWDPRARAAAVHTDDQGRFSLPVSEGQQLSLTARGDGRIGRALIGVVDDVDRFQSVTLVATSGRTVSGTVFSTTGAPLAFSGVHYRVRSLGLEGEAPTDGDGRFMLDGLPTNEDVEVWASGNATGAWGAQVATPSTTQLALTFIPPAW
ncbi:MAG: carboxypeptidase regulatory-like domain-containing protein [Deltaproteobacteria bacterium]|nr:carboxypeptidase regulatory-like domain-containing protein [Deltaproteobacteria bacterium]